MMKLNAIKNSSQSNVDPRIQNLQKPLWIGYGKAIEIRERIEALMEHPKMHRMPNIALIGHSNNGKTMILRSFLRKNSPEFQPDYDVNATPIRPVFMFQAPPEPDEGRMYRRMLAELYADAVGSEREPAETKLRRVSVILKNLKTKIILIDEFGFFMAGTPVKQRKLLNSLKFIGNELEIPIVVAGVPEALNLLQSDEQVANRFEPVFLPKWKMSTDYLRLLISIERSLALKEESNLKNEEIAQRILMESDGVIGYMMHLLQLLAVKAIKNQKERILLDDFSPLALKKIGWVHPSERHRFPN